MDAFDSWLKSFRGIDSDRQVALNAGIPVAIFARQLRAGTVTLETAVKVARAKQVSIVPALLAMDVLTEFDLKAFSTSHGVLDASDAELISEILRHVIAGQADWAHQPISQLEVNLDQRLGRAFEHLSPASPHLRLRSAHHGNQLRKRAGSPQETTEPLEENRP